MTDEDKISWLKLENSPYNFVSNEEFINLKKKWSRKDLTEIEDK